MHLSYTHVMDWNVQSRSLARFLVFNVDTEIHHTFIIASITESSKIF